MNHDDITDPKLRALFDLPALPKRRAGRPSAPLAATFDDALKNLSPREAEFTRRVLAGAEYANAYRLSSEKPVTDRTAQVNGSNMAQRKPVAHAIALGREAGALQAMTGIKYDVDKAMGELEAGMAFARETKNATALARFIELRAKLFRLVDANAPQQAQAVTFVFKRFGDTTPEVLIEGEVTGKDQQR